MKRMLMFLAFVVAGGGLLSFGLAQQIPTEGVVYGPHNLSVSGLGAVRATGEQQICIFCHTPHHSQPSSPLWNRRSLPTAYKPYTSNSLDAQPGQPTGSSKLCLSCHDGTIAVGNVLSRNQPIAMAGGMTTLAPGRTNLGTDLSDDHPISFAYDTALIAKDPKLKDPRTLPSAIRLDANGELQCTACHDPHSNANGKFLVMRNENSQLCNACHQTTDTTVAGHAQCAGCHKPHTAPSGPYLLTGKTVTATCTTCHGPNPPTGVTAQNIAADLAKTRNHDTNPSVTIANRAPGETNCSDCHGAHTMKNQATAAPLIPGNFGNVPGMNAAGGSIAKAQYEYEVCFRCHADNNAIQPYITRQVNVNNTRLDFATSAISFHPVLAVGKSTDVPSLRPGYTTGMVMYCSDCHSSDSSRKFGGTGPNGTHGSSVRPLLNAGYSVTDYTTESASAYALCYRCHDRTKLMSEQPPFRLHKKHVQEKQVPCATCHDAHGIPSGQGTTTKNSRLINFNTNLVMPDPVTKRLEYQDLGNRTGRCYLSCHGKNHSPLGY